MGSKYDTLPFERGKTFADGNSSVIGSGKNEQLLGKKYTVPDTQHGFGEDVVLRVVMWNDATAHTTTARSKGMALNGSGTTGTAGAKCTAVVAAKGGVGKPIDDAYAAGVVIPQYDLFYVVEEGRCDVDTGTTGALTAGTAVAFASDGTIGVAPATGEFVLGLVDETISTAAADDDADKCILVAPGLTPGTA